MKMGMKAKLSGSASAIIIVIAVCCAGFFLFRAATGASPPYPGLGVGSDGKPMNTEGMKGMASRMPADKNPFKGSGGPSDPAVSGVKPSAPPAGMKGGGFMGAPPAGGKSDPKAKAPDMKPEMKGEEGTSANKTSPEETKDAPTTPPKK